MPRASARLLCAQVVAADVFEEDEPGTAWAVLVQGYRVRTRGRLIKTAKATGNHLVAPLFPALRASPSLVCLPTLPPPLQ